MDHIICELCCFYPGITFEEPNGPVFRIQIARHKVCLGVNAFPF